MTGSSARKLRRGHANLLGGRAWRYTMAPLTYGEIQGFDLEQVIISGLLPPHFLSPDPVQDLRSYVADYLKEEEYSIGRIVIVSLEKHPGQLDSSIEVLPWRTFLEILWSGGFGV